MGCEGMTASKAARTEAETETGIRDLISYRLARTSSLMSRGAALRYRRLFDVSLGEWRALALLAAGPGMSLIELSRAAGLDKAQMSRVVAALTERGLVLRATTPKRGRAVELSLTPAGRDVYAGLIAEAGERDRAFRAALTPEELALLEGALDKLAGQAKAFIRAETAIEGDSSAEEPAEA
jgi:DNA-binding MarR family transcriptional regulator